MNRRSRLQVLDWAVPIGFGLVLCLIAPLRTALEFGADEGYELMKALLVSQGHPLYREVWNDQPPLHTELLALLFWLFGPSAYIGRLLSVGFAVVLVNSLYKVVSHWSGRVTGLVAVVLLMSSFSFLQLSVSVMIELPAMALALAAVWACSGYLDGKGKHWLVISGVLFGCALQVKLTAVIFAPSLAVAYLMRRIGRKRETDDLPVQAQRGQFREATVWCGAALATYGIILIAFYRLDTLPVFWASHFSPSTNTLPTDGYAFRPQLLLNDLALSVPAIVGVGLIGYKRKGDLLFPVVLLASALAIHLWHRPYWDYYGLHFALPMAWLGAEGIVGWFRAIWNMNVRASLAAKLRMGMGWLGWSMVISLVLTLAPQKVLEDVKKLSAAPLALKDVRVIEFRKHAAQTRWVFTDRVIYAFWAGLPVPPELAVIPSKRVWSGQISEAEIVECLLRYRPEQILLQSDWEESFGLSDYIQMYYYQPNSASEVGKLYLRK